MLTATTYRTTSATTTGLNLGTRTLAALANAVIVANFPHPGFDQSHQRKRKVRDGMRDSCQPSIMGIRASVLGSSRLPGLLGSCPGVEVWAERPPVVVEVVDSRRPAAVAKPLAAARPSTRPAARFAAGG